MVAVKCETDFVANGKDFIQMTQEILDAAVAAKAKSLDEVKTLKLANGEEAQAVVTQRSGITGEKMELDGYNFIEGDRKSTRLNSSHANISYAVFCLKKNKNYQL